MSEGGDQVILKSKSYKTKVKVNPFETTENDLKEIILLQKLLKIY